MVGLGIGSLCQTWGHEDRLTTHRGREQEKQQEEKKPNTGDRKAAAFKSSRRLSESRVQPSPTTYVTATSGEGGARCR